MTLHTRSLPALSALVILAACGGDPNSPGIEYMPDMYRSPAVEAYVDYGQDPYYFEDSAVVAQRNTQSARLPVAGTVPFSQDPAKAALNFPYPYPNTPEGYEQAGAELRAPLPMTEANVEQGKVLYEKFCVHCHGPKGEGDGSVVKNGGYPVPPSYTKADPPGLKSLPEGKIFHSLTYGKNVAMGSHASQLTKEERWLVTRYVQFLQNGGNMPGALPAETADTVATDQDTAAN